MKLIYLQPQRLLHHHSMLSSLLQDSMLRSLLPLLFAAAGLNAALAPAAFISTAILAVLL